MCVVVTGASGLIGNTLLRQLDEGQPVLAVCRTRPSGISTGGEWLPHAFDGSPLPKRLLETNAQTIIHLAQSPNFRKFPGSALEVFNVNVQSTASLLDYAVRSGARSFVYASSGGIYGFGDEGFKEDHPLMPGDAIGHYLGSKHCGEILAESYSGLLTIVILRFFFVYGSEQRPDMLIPRLVHSVANGVPIELHGESGIRLNPVHVEDAACAVRAATQLSEGHKINVAGPDPLSLREIAERIGASVNREPVFSASDVKPRSLVGDISKMRRLLCPPNIHFRDGIEEVCHSLMKPRLAPEAARHVE